MYPSKTFRSVLLPALLVLVTGCGFQLQNKAVLPPEMVQTKLEVAAPYSRFAQRLESLLEQNGVDVVRSSETAAILEVPLNRRRQEIQSIGDNARVREYLIRHTVHFRLLDHEGNELIPLQIFEQSRVYAFNEQDILAAEREREFLSKDLADSLASMVVRRIGTYEIK